MMKVKNKNKSKNLSRKPSEEQKIIIKDSENNNVIVNAVAGSGKTTTILFIAEHRADKNILLLTYNTKLRIETKEKAEKQGFNNIEIHTFHSFYQKYFDYCINDIMMDKIINAKQEPKQGYNYDMIILDECQDLTKLLYCSVKYLCSFLQNLRETKFIVLGDKNQNIYQYKGADYRFLTLASKLFNWNKYNWTYRTLSVSYRLTKNTAQVVNECLLKENRIVPFKQKTSKDVYYIVNNVFNPLSIVDVIDSLIKTGQYSPSDFLILSYTLKSKGIRKKEKPITKISNVLSDKDYKVYVPNKDTEEINETLVKNKILFSSFHQSKGMERKVVIIFGLDDFLETYSEEFKSETVPNIVYVAMTRSTKFTLITQSYTSGPLKCLDINKVKEIAEYSLDTNLKETTKSAKIKIKNVLEFEEKEMEQIIDNSRARNVLEILNHLNYEIVKWFLDNVSLELKLPKGETIIYNSNISIILPGGLEYFEPVNDIFGSVISMQYEFNTTKKIATLENLKEAISNGTFEDFTDINNDNSMILTIKYHALSTKDLISIYLKNYYLSTGDKSRIKQLKNRNFITPKILDKSISRLESLNVLYNFVKNDFNVFVSNDRLYGYIDHVAIDSNNVHYVINYKFTRELRPEHILTICLYKYLYSEASECKALLYNICTNELIEVNVPNLSEIVESIVERSDNKIIVSDEQFINEIFDFTKNINMNIDEKVFMH